MARRNLGGFFLADLWLCHRPWIIQAVRSRKASAAGLAGAKQDARYGGVKMSRHPPQPLLEGPETKKVAP